MSASHATLRFITALLILAGILLLRRPVFGQTTNLHQPVASGTAAQPSIQPAN